VTEGSGGRAWRDRAFHRLAYGAADRPRLVLADGARGTVMDCSETGVRYRPDPRDPLPTFGMIVEGEIDFRAAGPTPFTGRVIRVAPAEVALYLPPPGGIPFRAILAEQRALRARYPFAEDGSG
jgi:hypothetical protein